MVGKVPCIRLLIRRGANMDAVPDLAMWGCLHLSVETGRADCLEELLREGARTDLVNNVRLRRAAAAALLRRCESCC